ALMTAIVSWFVMRSRVMADSYLIDGYNLLHMLGMVQKRVGPGELDLARRRLLDFLVAIFAAEVQHVTIVFDAQPPPPRVKRQHEYQGMHVDFAPKTQSADDRIEDLIEQAKEPRRLVVISNDSRLQDAARRRGAKAWSHEDLLDFVDKKADAATKNEGEKE